MPAVLPFDQFGFQEAQQEYGKVDTLRRALPGDLFVLAQVWSAA